MSSDQERGFSLVNVGALAEPANTFISRVSDLVGGLFEPSQIRRVAQAKANAAVTKAKAEIEITDLHKRAARRWIEEEARHQQNMEGIAAKALPLIEQTADPSSVDDDWIIHFFDRCRKVSSEQMQDLWSHALASEANGPGSFSKRTVTALAGLDAVEARWFTALCGYVAVVDGMKVPLVFDTEDDVYDVRGVTFEIISDLASIGLIRMGGFQATELPKDHTVYYYDKPLHLTMPRDSSNELNIGEVFLTRIGKELAPICGGEPVDGFLAYVSTKWEDYVSANVSGE